MYNTVDFTISIFETYKKKINVIDLEQIKIVFNINVWYKPTLSSFLISVFWSSGNQRWTDFGG